MNLVKNKDKRLFDFVITVDGVPDKENEIMPEEEIEEALDNWMIKDSPITMEHTNKIVGKGIRHWVEEVDGKKNRMGRGLIYDDELGDIAWNKIKNHTYNSVSIGGASFNPTDLPNGQRELRKLNIAEVAVCEKGMHPDADITDFNSVAKGVAFVMKADIKKFDEKAIEEFSKEDVEKKIEEFIFKGCSKEFEDCVRKVKRENPDANAYAVCHQSLGKAALEENSAEGKIIEKFRGESMQAKDAKKQDELTDAKTPETAAPATDYVTKEELGQLLTDFKKELIAELTAPANVQDAAKTASPDGTEEKEKTGEASTQEKDKVNVSKLKEEILKEVKKSLNLAEKTETPKPSDVSKKQNDCYEKLKKNEHIGFADIRKSRRESDEQELKAILEN